MKKLSLVFLSAAVSFIIACGTIPPAQVDSDPAQSVEDDGSDYEYYEDEDPGYYDDPYSDDNSYEYDDETYSDDSSYYDDPYSDDQTDGAAVQILPDDASGEDIPDDTQAEASLPDEESSEPAAETQDIALPEPAAPEPPPLEPAPEPDPAPAAPPAPQSAPPPAAPPAPAPPAPAPVAPTPAPPPAPAPPPEPPRYIRPAEPAPAPPPGREPVPMPPNPVPNLPSRPPVSPVDEGIVYSRTVRLTVGQWLEVPFRGTGWTYLGETPSRRGLSYESHYADSEGQYFVFLAEQSGDYSLRFYKQDYIRDSITNDYVRVIVEEAPRRAGASNAPVDRGPVIAEPRWPPLPELSPGSGGNLSGGTAPDPGAPPALTPTASAPSAPMEAAPDPAPVSSPSSAEDFLQQARQQLQAGNIPAALALLDQFREAFPGGSDEALSLYGQALEAVGPSRDIRSALEYYRRLVREYPQSVWYDEARRRIAYLERYYFNIR